MVQDSAGGCEDVSDVHLLEGVDENFVDISEKNLSKSLVYAIVLVEECGGGVESIETFGDLVASGVDWDYGYRAGVEGNDERGGQ